MSIEASNIKKSYGQKLVLNDISIKISNGEIVGLLGPNGAGKTTFFYSIMGLINVDGGTITVNNKNVTNLPVYLRAREAIGYLAQEPSIFRKLTVEENIFSAIEIYYNSFDQKQSILKKMLQEFNLEHLKNQKAYTLSGGEKRRCEIARVLVSNPRYLLLDEPFVGIDPKTIEELQTIVLKLKNDGLGILLTDHNVRETLEIVDRAYIIYAGDILIHGDAQKLVNDESARKIYLGQKFRL